MALGDRAHGGRDALTQLDDLGGTLRNISTDLTNVEVPQPVDSFEVTGMTETRKSYIPGQIDTPVAITGNLNAGTALNAAHKVLSAINGVSTATFSFEHYPAGSASGKPKLSGEVFCLGYTVRAPLGGGVTFDASLMPANSTGLVWSTV